MIHEYKLGEKIEITTKFLYELVDGSHLMIVLEAGRIIDKCLEK